MKIINRKIIKIMIAVLLVINSTTLVHGVPKFPLTIKIKTQFQLDLLLAKTDSEIRSAIRNGADPNDYWAQPLYIALKHFNFELAKWLVRHRAKPKFKGYSNETPLEFLRNSVSTPETIKLIRLLERYAKKHK